MGVDEPAAEAGRQRRLVQPEPAEEVRKPIGRRHLAVVEGAQPLRLPPAVGERLVAGLEADVRRLRSQDRVQHAGRGADGLAIDLDFGHPFPVEADERVEEVEEHGGVRHQSGFLAA